MEMYEKILRFSLICFIISVLYTFNPFYGIRDRFLDLEKGVSNVTVVFRPSPANLHQRSLNLETFEKPELIDLGSVKKKTGLLKEEVKIKEPDSFHYSSSVFEKGSTSSSETPISPNEASRSSSEAVYAKTADEVFRANTPVTTKGVLHRSRSRKAESKWRHLQQAMQVASRFRALPTQSADLKPSQSSKPKIIPDMHPELVSRINLWKYSAEKKKKALDNENLEEKKSLWNRVRQMFGLGLIKEDIEEPKNENSKIHDVEDNLIKNSETSHLSSKSRARWRKAKVAIQASQKFKGITDRVIETLDSVTEKIHREAQFLEAWMNNLEKINNFLNDVDEAINLKEIVGFLPHVEVNPLQI
ncbi:hypothetical protein BY996DRAFT_6410842 [Phakopsora pachyrhizi]|uniref:Expressed protein n=1 Tax=Phakopsora pachyrhizi TaxID=170000 RepID=A0AAV0AKQ3_PHAPC|nr:hypothetical protein BY996DRAFT_6410842 [Phakopsora pachyrhizi]CAH7669134.1 expressed protein [Phakopsora pachyrhizi]